MESDVLLSARQIAVDLVVLRVARDRDVVDHEVELQEFTGCSQPVDLRLTQLEAQRQLVEITMDVRDDLTLSRRVAGYGDRVGLCRTRQGHTGSEQACGECEC